MSLLSSIAWLLLITSVYMYITNIGACCPAGICKQAFIWSVLSVLWPVHVRPAHCLLFIERSSRWCQSICAGVLIVLFMFWFCKNL